MDPFGEIVRSCVLTASQEDILSRSHFHGESVDDLDMDPFADILRSCFLTASQEEYLRHSGIHGQPIQNLAAPSTAQGDEEGLGRQITEASAGIFNRSSPRDLPEDKQEVEEVRVREECPSHVRQAPAQKTLENSPLEMPADKTLEKSTLHPPLQNIPHDLRQISAEKTVEKPPASKRKSAVEIESGCSSGSAGKKSRAERIAGEHSRPAGGTPNAFNDSPAQQPHEEQQPSNIQCSDDKGLPVDEFSNFRYKKPSNFKRFPSLKQFKEALGIDKTNPNNVCVRRKLPASIQGPADENGGCSGGGGKPISDARGLGHSRSTLLLNVAEALSKKSEYGTRTESGGTENGSILEAAKQAGYAFPRPRWWHPEGYSKRRR
ncbi:hypothetical protein ACLOJK_020344 [Asimina triloba]